ncbi:hypothetical protein D9M68_871870 [compost metagenome]
MQSGGQGANAIEARGAEHEGAQRILITNDHVQPAIGLAGAALSQRAGIRRRAGQRLHAVRSDPLAGFTIADAQRPSRLPIEQGVIGTEIQLRLVEQ